MLVETLKGVKLDRRPNFVSSTVTVDDQGNFQEWTNIGSPKNEHAANVHSKYSKGVAQAYEVCEFLIVVPCSWVTFQCRKLGKNLVLSRSSSEIGR